MDATVTLTPGLVSRIEAEAANRNVDTETATIQLLEERLGLSPEVLLALYHEVCNSHRAITDFRAKLLALLPIAAGAVLALTTVTVTAAGGLLVALGIFGALATGGLFMYELRQIDLCKQLRNHGTWIERQLGIEAGQFGGRRRNLTLGKVYLPQAHRCRDDKLTAAETCGRHGPDDPGGSVGAEVAGYIVYYTVMAAWLALAVLGGVRLVI